LCKIGRILNDDISLADAGYAEQQCLTLVVPKPSAPAAAPVVVAVLTSEQPPVVSSQQGQPVMRREGTVKADADISAVLEAPREIFPRRFYEKLDEAFAQHLSRTGRNEEEAMGLRRGMSLALTGRVRWNDEHQRDYRDVPSSEKSCPVPSSAPSLGQSCSASANVGQPVSVGASVPTPTPMLVSSASAAFPNSYPSSAPPPPAINQATEWLDEDGRVCPKAVDYATQCPKGHALVPFVNGGCNSPVQHLACRVCHAFAELERASQWLVCSATGCCAGYAVCDCCVSAGQQAPAAIAAGEGFITLVTRTSIKSALWCCSYLLLQGVSLEYLRWIHAEFGSSLGRLTASQFEKMFLRPRTSRRRCSVTEELAAHADTAHHVGPATWFISHTWSNPFAHTLQAILQFFESRADAANAMLWFDMFVDSQHADAGPSKSTQWYTTTFKNSIARIGRLLLVVDVWNNPTALKRAW
jgi:hypothetical protein